MPAVPCINGNVRIAGGDGISYGRVEVCISGVWGTICSDAFWDNTDAGVICRELGFPQHGIPYAQTVLLIEFT